MEPEKLEGEVLAIRHRNSENDWSVLHAQVKGAPGVCVVVGYTAAMVGQVIHAQGRWTRSKYGVQFEASQIVASSPATHRGLISYLASGVIKGMGEKLAHSLVAHFGVDILRILDEDPSRVSEVRGVGAAKAQRIRMAWGEQKAVQKIMVFLHSQGISPSLCRRIHAAYGDDAVEILSENPYRLCLEVRGIGFKTADGIARELAVPMTSPYRIVAGMIHLMQEITGQGHCGCALEEFVTRAAEALEVDCEQVRSALEGAMTGQRPAFVRHGEEVYSTRLSMAEERIASGLLAQLATAPAWAQWVDEALVERSAAECGMRLANKQRQAVEMALRRKVSVITGGPGCGKTATLKVVLAAFRHLRLKVALAAPTGKAAQRAREATGMDALTVHRLLGLRGTEEDGESHLHADVLVLDESSMVDVRLMAKIVAALEPKTAVVMVGDVDQLPSVGPGAVLSDCIQSGVIPVTVLDEIFRQAAGSAIITNAHAINRGEAPRSAGREGDFFLLTEQNTPSIVSAMRHPDSSEIPGRVAEAVAREIEQLVAQRLPARYGFDPIADIQVLAPMNKGGCGVHELNQRLQATLNPNPPQWTERFGIRYGVGDKVIQVRNNYELDIFNGDVGIVTGVDDALETVQVRFDGRVVAIPFDDLEDLKLAYAMTIHKSQGSQAPAIVIPMVTQHWTMLQRNLLYTGVTRAAKLALVVGQARAIATAVRTRSAMLRLTRLRRLLQEGAAQRPDAARWELAE